MLVNLLGLDEEESAEFLRAVREVHPDAAPGLVLVTLLEAELPNVFTIDPAGLAADLGTSEVEIGRLLDQVSLIPGDLRDHNVDWVPAANPCWSRPFIRVEEGYFLPVPGLLSAFKYEIMEQAFSASPKMLKSYQRARASVLETETAEHLGRVFGPDNVHTGLKWTDPADGREYESDVVVTFDDYLVVAECKSHAARNAARRGAPKAAAKLGKNVYLSASEQSARLLRLLAETDEPIVFETSSKKQLTIASDPSRSAVRLTVTLDFIGGAASRASEQEALTGRSGDYAVSMPVTDLEILCDALDRPEQLLHYLHSRIGLERRLMFMGDETDLLGFYLKTRFAVSYLPEKNALLQLSPLGRQFDSWYLPDPSTAAGPSGRVRNTLYWQSFIDRLKKSGGRGWARGAAILSGLPIEEQVRAERGVRDLQKRVRAAGDFLVNNNIMVVDATWQRDELIAIWVHPRGSERSEIRRRTINTAQNVADDENAEWVVVLAISTEPRAGWPYTNCYVARRDRTDGLPDAEKKE